MEVQSVTVGLEFTHNLGNYSNLKPMVSISALISDGELPGQVLEILRLSVLEQIDLLIKDGVLEHKMRLKSLEERPF